jgi:methyl-accepting chemotaxis protein/methyl-accepting chemotaxis protein-1 (serine sensor receptor)
VDELRPLVNTEGSRRSLDDFESVVNRYEDVSHQLVAEASAGRVADGIAILKGKGKPLGAAMETASADVAKEERRWLAKAMAEVNGRAQTATLVQLICLLAQLATAVGLSVVSWHIVKTLRRSATEMTGVAREVCGEAKQAADRSQSLAAGASGQAASIQETSAATEEVRAIAAQIHGKTGESAKCMGCAMDDVRGAERAIERAAEAMHVLTASQKKISGIIQTIEGLAFQTNLLALNAAVEAARAGEAGASFAVVADEVRTLARRSAEAAQGTAGLIEESAARSAEAHRTLEDVESCVRAIAASVVKGKELVDIVNTTSEQQTQGMQQIAQAMLAMSQITEKAAATA